MTIAVCRFAKSFRGSMPPDPLEPFSFLNLHQILTEKIRLIKMSKFNALVLEKFSEISEYAFDMKHFQRAYVI